MKIPLRDEDLLVIQVPSPGFDPQEVQTALEPLGMTACLIERSSLAEAELKRLLIERGITWVWRLVDLQEAVMPQTQHLEPLVRVLQSMLGRLSPTRDFIIIDRYLFSKGTDATTLMSLLAPIVKTVTRIQFITGPRPDPMLLDQVRGSLLAHSSEISVVHSVSDDFHDRFWLADRSRGLFLGASLNGLGKRYALADYIAPNDVLEIIAALDARGLLEERHERT